MLLNEVPLEEKFLKLFSEAGIEKLFPPQEAAVSAGLLEKKNLILATPTASGKTLTAELAAARTLAEGGKVVYIVPLRALAFEKFEEFKKYEKIGYTIRIEVGDNDSSKYAHKPRYDILIATAEKCDSILRSRPEWFTGVGLLVLDEIHLIASDRGPVYEILAAKLRKLLPTMQVLGLSATIGNADELAGWLSAELVESTWRPVKLAEEVSVGGEYEDLRKSVKENLSDGGQVMVFVNTRKSAESVAEKLGEDLKLGGKKELAEISEGILSALSSPTRQCQRLSECVRNGAAFHHAGLVNSQRKAVEDAFKEGLIKVIVATPTLCLRGDSKVWCGVDEIPVGSLKAGRPILGLKGSEIKSLKTADVIGLASPEKLVKIVTANYGPIYVTKNHKMLLRTGDKRVLVEASACKVGDAIATVRRLKTDEHRAKWSDFVKDNRLPFADSELDDSIYYLIGVFLGDGYSGAEIHKGGVKYKGSPSVVSEDKEIFEKVADVCKRYGLHYNITENSYGTAQIVLTKAKWFREFLVRCGVDLGPNKRIDKRLMMAPQHKLAHLLRGLFDTDGCMEKRGRISFSNTSKGLISDLRKSLLRYGIVTWIREKKGHPITMHGKIYSSSNGQELFIQNREGILDFHRHVGFNLRRKQDALNKVINDYGVNKVSCKRCGYVFHPNLFTGRTRAQKEWGRRKKAVIETLGGQGELTSRELVSVLGHEPRKKEARINHHYALVKKRRFGANEWIWSLNDLGVWVYKNLLKRNSEVADYFTEENDCPLCNCRLEKNVRGTWRSKAFEGDIFWDDVKNVSVVKNKGNRVYDVVLPDDGSNDHFFVAEGIIVHNSAGVNLPSRTVILRDVKRYGLSGLDYIPVFEYKQMTGRAGRPKYDKSGRAVTLAKNESECEYITEKYVNGEVEPIYSQLGIEPVLRFHVLSAVASNFTRTSEALLEFFASTFYGFQYGVADSFRATVEKITNQLIEWGFLIRDGRFLIPTPLGARVSELYLDPQTARNIVNLLSKAEAERKWPVVGLLEVLCDASEMASLSVKPTEESALWSQAYSMEGDFYRDIGGFDLDWDFLPRFKTALLFDGWVNEKTEDELMEDYDVTPGQLYQRLNILEWLAYAGTELSRLEGLKKTMVEVKKLEERIKHGVREELVPLVSIKYVGRARARRLYAAGLKKPGDVKEASLEKLSQIIGKKTAEKIMAELV